MSPVQSVSSDHHNAVGVERTVGQISREILRVLEGAWSLRRSQSKLFAPEHHRGISQTNISCLMLSFCLAWIGSSFFTLIDCEPHELFVEADVMGCNVSQYDSSRVRNLTYAIHPRSFLDWCGSNPERFRNNIHFHSGVSNTTLLAFWWMNYKKSTSYDNCEYVGRKIVPLLQDRQTKNTSSTEKITIASSSIPRFTKWSSKDPYFVITMPCADKAFCYCYKSGVFLAALCWTLKLWPQLIVGLTRCSP